MADLQPGRAQLLQFMVRLTRKPLQELPSVQFEQPAMFGFSRLRL